MNTLQYALARYPICPALSSTDDFERAGKALSEIVLVLNIDICDLDRIVSGLQMEGKIVLVHLDLSGGLKKDASSLRYLSTRLGVDGIVTTHSSLISAAKKLNLITVQRIFVFDTASITQGLKTARSAGPDAIEILPGVVLPNIIERVNKDNYNIIAGGLINTQDEVETILRSGALGVSSSNKDLWNIDIRSRRM